MTAALLEIRGLHASYGATHVIHGVDLMLKEGGVTALLGANGAGKTTVLRAIFNMVRTRGDIFLSGEKISGRSTEDIVRRGFGHVPDGRGTFTAMTTEENLRLGAYTRKDGKDVLSDIERMYSRFPVLKDRRNQQAGTLSGGEQQMLAIARALMLRPKILLLDEPSFGLAPLIVAEIFEIMSRINKEDGVSILLIEQNANLALDLADDAYLLETGRIVISGTAKDMKSDEAVRRSYLGY